MNGSLEPTGHHEFKEDKTADGQVWPGVPCKESKPLQKDGEGPENESCGG